MFTTTMVLKRPSSPHWTSYHQIGCHVKRTYSPSPSPLFNPDQLDTQCTHPTERTQSAPPTPALHTRQTKTHKRAKSNDITASLSYLLTHLHLTFPLSSLLYSQQTSPTKTQERKKKLIQVKTTLSNSHRVYLKPRTNQRTKTKTKKVEEKVEEKRRGKEKAPIRRSKPSSLRSSSPPCQPSHHPNPPRLTNRKVKNRDRERRMCSNLHILTPQFPPQKKRSPNFPVR